jgi:hypothetical protein
MGELVHNRRGQSDLLRADLPDQIGPASETLHGLFGGAVEGIVHSDELTVMQKHPLSRVLGF